MHQPETMPPSMSSRSIFPALALLFTALVHYALAISPNIGYQVAINTFRIDIFRAGSSGDNSNFRIGGVSNYTFIVPLTIIRRGSPSDDLQVTLFTRPYDYDEDQPPQEVQVYTESVFMNERSSYDVTATFNISTNSTEDVVHYLRAQVNIQVRLFRRDRSSCK